MNNDQSCESCRFALEMNGQYLCRRYPPTAHPIPMPARNALGQVVPQISNVTATPQVQPDMWCGEYALKVHLQKLS